MGGALWFNRWGTYGLNGWSSYDKVSFCFIWKYAQKCWSSGEYPFRSSHDHRFRISSTIADIFFSVNQWYFSCWLLYAWVFSSVHMMVYQLSMAQLRVVQCKHISMFCDQLLQATELIVCESALFKSQHVKQLLYSLGQWTGYFMNLWMLGFTLSPAVAQPESRDQMVGMAMCYYK